MNRFGSVVAFVLMCAVAAQAQAGLAGKWEGETAAGASVLLDLSVNGTELTGTLTRNDQTSTLSEGKVTKNTFTFKVMLSGRMERFSGELAGDQLKVWLDRQGASSAIVLTRVKTT